MKFASATPPSRQGKKQIIAFLYPNQAEAAYGKAERDGKSNQEVIGEALNAVFTSYGMPPPINSGHRRVVRRNKSRASVRNDTRGPSCRSGRVSYGGWFDEAVVAKVHAFAAELGLSIQAIVERGLTLVTGVSPEAPAPWAMAEVRAEAEPELVD